MTTIELKVIIKTCDTLTKEDLHRMINKMPHDILEADYLEDTYKEEVTVSFGTMSEYISSKASLDNLKIT